MNTLCIFYRNACRELRLEDVDRKLLMRLARELATNTIKRQLAWNVKDQFITLWFISAGRFPEIVNLPIVDWVAGQLPFELNANEIQLLKS